MSSDVRAPREITALLGQGASYSGKLTFEGRVRIDGDFDGEVFSPGTLVIGEGAEIRGTLDVGVLIVLGGEVWGKVHARELVEVHAAAIVHADVETPQVFIDRGAVFDGRCTMGRDSKSPSAQHDLSGEQLLDELSASVELPPSDEPDEDVAESEQTFGDFDVSALRADASEE